MIEDDPEAPVPVLVHASSAEEEEYEEIAPAVSFFSTIDIDWASASHLEEENIQTPITDMEYEQEEIPVGDGVAETMPDEDEDAPLLHSEGGLAGGIAAGMEFDEDDDEESTASYENDEEDEDHTDIDTEIRERHGTLGLQLFKNLQSTKALGCEPDAHFLRCIIELYLQSTTSSSSHSPSTQPNIISSLLSLSDLQDALVKRPVLECNEALVVKVMLDLYDAYYTSHDSPLFLVYQLQIIPLAIRFYGALSDALLRSLVKHLHVLTSSVKDPGVLQLASRTFLVLDSVAQYVDLYESRRREYRNLAEGNTLAMYFC
mmetsp:Transcript_9661/g.16745  ORF Transcript_9661/g.16745 Transcript_9661/m.16745 type:complete len:317 (-) Transcript_9661:156-1106(-)